MSIAVIATNTAPLDAVGAKPGRVIVARNVTPFAGRVGEVIPGDKAVIAGKVRVNFPARDGDRLDWRDAAVAYYHPAALIYG